MRAFVALYEAIDATNSTNRKVAAVRDYFTKVEPADAAWAVFVLSGQRLTRVVGGAALRTWVIEASGLPEWLVLESYAAVGDLAETASLLASGRASEAATPSAPSSPAADAQGRFDFAEPDAIEDGAWRGLDASSSLAAWFERGVLPLRGLDPSRQRERVLHWWSRLAPAEAFVLTKLLTGALRVGVSRSLLVRALGEHTGLPTATIAHRLMGEWAPSPEAFGVLTAPGEQGEADRTRPYPFCLATPLDTSPDDLGPLGEWLAEWKWDGIRAQLVRRSRVSLLWSRGEELVTDRYPEIIAAALRLPQSAVLDGEIVAWKEGRAQPFAVLQRRIGRRTLGRRILAEAPVAFLAFDCLELDDVDWRGRPLEERRAALERLVDRAASDRLMVSPVLGAENWSAVARARDESRARGVEGVMLKRRRSPYGVGRRRGDWWKWKVDPFTVDAVLVYAQAGHGRRATLFTDYTFAVWHEGGLVPMAKAYSGLDNREIDELDAWIRAHTVERFGPVRSIDPVQVFELGFEGIARSSRHRGGVALRFPRILRWRRDKAAADADTLQALMELADAHR